MNVFHIVLDVLVLILLVIPIVMGIKRGFVYTALHFGKTLIAFLLACLFAKPLGIFLKNKWIYGFVNDKIVALFEGVNLDTISENGLVDKIPDAIKNTLAACGMDIESMASEAAQKGSEMLNSFVGDVSNSVAGVLSFALAFLGIFLVSLLLIFLLRSAIDAIVKRLPIIRTCNTLLGALFGVLIGVVSAWIGAQILVGVFGLVVHIDWTETYILSFFYRANPLQWLLNVAVQSMAGIAAI